ncbi:3-hydroxyacyl-CoA dehydrogenase family protein [Anaeromicropila populeti]|uniref:3-hydroxybutyryl-CoA dehydrogenase n=1 Tax=Anaeromicropila populeti TaxID=37658 RepID=A0A1I6IFE7_9FIRM|nr:3-hydroxyacyl-CoA dehydrogenase family protein [Anaeromicropila populeti]SFR65462.1 3-hydroxybutyryl-CoA dehydrogenase [Anaeromicropila populeti]
MTKEDIQEVVVIGAGLMGASIAQSFPEYVTNTSIYCNDAKEFERAKTIIRNCQETLVLHGVIGEEESKKVQDSIVYTTEKSCFAKADLVIEAIPEVLELKKEVFYEISRLVPNECILVTNTSAISINELSTAVQYPERFCGSHWLNPPHIIPLVEITKGDYTSDKVAELLYDLYKSMHKQPVILKKDVKGFLSNRLQFALLREASYLVESGVATPEDIDKTLKYGNGLRYMCSGPFRIADLGGIQVFNNVAKYLYPDLSDEKRENRLLKERAENGELGISTGRGFYEYTLESALKEEYERDKKILHILQMNQETEASL